MLGEQMNSCLYVEEMKISASSIVENNNRRVRESILHRWLNDDIDVFHLFWRRVEES